MKKIIKISYLYFATGIILCLYVLLSKYEAELNVHDTYYVFSENSFALFVSLIYLILGVIYLVIEKHLNSWTKILQYLMFNIPIIYFMFADLNDFYNLDYILKNPIAYKWNTEYVPKALTFSFLTSICFFILLFVIAFFKWRKNNKASI